MKAVALKAYLPIDHPHSLLDVDLPQPSPEPHDLLVAVQAISVNPVDTKVRAPKDRIEESYRILGWDAVGKVVAVGSAVSLFKPGDEVYYAGSIDRPGSNAQWQLVDERIVGRKPKAITKAEAAALPLTAITAWEGLFDRLGVSRTGQHAGQSILIIGAAGGVGSLAIQLAKTQAQLQVIATASRPESSNWCKQLGADYVINHHQNMVEQFKALGVAAPDFIFCLNDTQGHWAQMCELIKPQGRICSIVETSQPLELDKLKSKSASFAWEFMFTRARYQTPDMIEQHKLLNALADLIDTGVIRTSLNQVLSPINAANLRQAHRQIESGKTIGKIVLENWE